MSRSAIDPFTTEIVRHALDTIADDMAMNLMRSAYSSIVRDAMDFSTAVCDSGGCTVAQGTTVTLHLGSFYDAMQNLIATAGASVAPGDVFIFNDPYLAAGQHLPDIYIVKPLFFDDRLVAWATTIAHHADVGGIVAGSNALGAHEIYQEGLRLPVLKLCEAGRFNRAIFDIIEANVRVPDQVIGDLHSQLAACRTCETGLEELFESHGADYMAASFAAIHDHAEALARAEISRIPDGTYAFEDHIDGIGEDPEPIVLKSRITIAGSEALVDMTGTAAQVPGGINSPLPYTKAAAYTALRAVMAEDLPNSHGFTRPIRVTAPPGTLVNPVSPGACGARGITGYRMIDCLMGALAQAVPDRVTADNCGGPTLSTFSGYRDGRAFVLCEAIMGNWGAAIDHDGQDGVPHLGGNMANVPVELIEARYPLEIRHYGLVRDSGGAGRYRGGLAIRRDYEALADGVMLNVRTDKRRFPPHGLFGGQPGTPSESFLESNGETRLLPVMLMEPVAMSKGTVWRQVTAGAGGYGDPGERDPEAVLLDLREERISAETARTIYGVEPPVGD